MKRSYRKALKHCFGTNEFKPKNPQCFWCQHKKACEKESRTKYPEVHTPEYHIKYHNVRKKYRNNVTPEE